MNKPIQKPNNPCFSSGPCAKRPGWSLEALANFEPGRSHRAKTQKAKLQEVIDLTKETLNIPADYLVGIVPASDTGAVEMAMWNLLGERGVDVLSWESFSGDWAIDAESELKLEDLRIHHADYGLLPDLSQVDTDRDVVFTFNGTTSGVRVPNCDWIKADRQGLTICDATSAVFAMEMDWQKLDVVTFSWQKAMGGEAGHGMLILSPRAVARLESYTPNRAIPKIFRLTKKQKLIAAIFEGATINTPSMIATEDALDSLRWIKSLGGAAATIKRSEANLQVFKEWVAKTAWVEFLAEDASTISSTSMCFKIVDEAYQQLSEENKESLLKDLVKFLEQEKVAYDIAAYRDAPAGLRVWGGSTVEASDIKILTEWLDYAYAKTLENYQKAA